MQKRSHAASASAFSWALTGPRTRIRASNFGNHPAASGVIGPMTPEAAGWFPKLEARILVLGPVSAQEKADALAACDLFCMPSLSEILPTVYLEAWSFAKPVVGGRAPGLTDLVEGNGAGIAVGQDSAEISRAICQLLKDRTLRAAMGRRGKELVSNTYSLDRVAGAHE